MNKNYEVVLNTSRNFDMQRIAVELADRSDAQFINARQNWIAAIFACISSNEVYVPTQSIYNLCFLIIARIARTRVTVGLHDVVPHCKRDRWKFSIYNRSISLLASRVLIFSKFSMQQYIEKYGNKKAIGPYYFGANLQVSPTKLKDIDITFIGRFREYQGIEHLEPIIKHFSTKKILIVGRDARTDYSIFKNVEFYKCYISDEALFDLLARTKVQIFPYKSATQSGTIPLAIAANASIVAFDVGGLREQTFEKLGHFVQPSDLDAFIVATSRALNNSGKKSIYNEWCNAAKELSVKI